MKEIKLKLSDSLVVPTEKVIARKDDGYWIHLRGKPEDPEPDFSDCKECNELPFGPLSPEALKHHSNRELPGKYLFFDPNRDLLLDFLRLMILQHGFNVGKVSIKPLPKGTDNVLCLHWRDGSREAEVEALGRQRGIRYATYKSDAETLAGQYSNKALREGLRELQDEERAAHRSRQL